MSGMKTVHLENISWFLLLFLAGQQIPRKYQPHKNDADTLWTLSNMRNFIIRNFSESCKCYVLFESSVFAIKEL